MTVTVWPLEALAGLTDTVPFSVPETDTLLVPLEELEYPLAEQERTVLRLNLPEFVYAPVLAGSRAGTVSVLVDGVELTSVPVYWRYSVWEEA